MGIKYYIGIDIGGTKSAVVLASNDGELLEREEFLTEKGKNSWQTTVDGLKSSVTDYSKQKKIESIGISCGGPLDSKKGIILSPPNLPGWDAVPISRIFKEKFKVPVYLENEVPWLSGYLVQVKVFVI